MFNLTNDLGIDLGTSNILIYLKGRGVILDEPSVVAYDKDTNRIKAIGEEAKEMLGRTPGNLVAIKPLQNGVISDYAVTEKMLKYFIQKAIGKHRFFKPVISICVPCGSTEVERKAVEDATYMAGARYVELIEEPLAAAIGAGVDISKPCGNMIVDIGGGTTDVAVISLGGIVYSTSIKVAGDDFDEAIAKYVKTKYQINIANRTAEEIKIKIGTCYKKKETLSMDIKGRDIVSALPKMVSLTNNELEEALREPVSQIADAIRSVFEHVQTDLVSDIADRGILLTGGGALLGGLEDYLEEKTSIFTTVAENPRRCVAIGTGRYVEVVGRHNSKQN